MDEVCWGSPWYQGLTAGALAIGLLQGMWIWLLDIGLSLIDLGARLAIQNTVAEVIVVSYNWLSGCPLANALITLKVLMWNIWNRSKLWIAQRYMHEANIDINSKCVLSGAQVTWNYNFCIGALSLQDW
jgi:hypothetical protein